MTSGSVSTRDATAEDADAIGRIHVRCWQHAYVGMVPQELLDSLDEEQRVGQWRRRLEAGNDPGGATLVSCDAVGAVTGFAQVGASGADDAPTDLGVLYAIYLDPSAIGSGVGRALLAAAMDRLRALGYTRASLEVLPANTRARKVYEAAGWRAEGDIWLVTHGSGHELPHQRYVVEL